MFAYTERGIKKMYIRLKENVHTFQAKRMDVLVKMYGRLF